MSQRSGPAPEPSPQIWLPPSAVEDHGLPPGELDLLVNYACAMRAAQGFELALAVTAIRLRRKSSPLGIRKGDTPETLAKRISRTLSGGQSSLTRGTATSLAKEICPKLPGPLATDISAAAERRNALAHDFFRSGAASNANSAEQAKSARAAHDQLEAATAQLMAERERWPVPQSLIPPASQRPLPDGPALDNLLTKAALFLVSGSAPAMETEIVTFARWPLMVVRRDASTA